jgi:excisionase family DNA binding protein
MKLERHYSTGRAAQTLGVSKRTLYGWIRQDKIKCVRLPNGHYRIPETEILKMLYVHEKNVLNQDKTLQNVVKRSC